MSTDPTSGTTSSPDEDGAGLTVRRADGVGAIGSDATGSGPTQRLVVAGELDLAAAPLLGNPLRRAIRDGHTDVVVDVRELSFCDAAGLHVLVSAAADLRVRGGRLTLYGPCAALQLLLDAVEETTIDLVPAPD